MPSPALQRLHALIYSLLYPGFLGVFLIGMFPNTDKPKSYWGWNGIDPPWAILFILYFASQHIEATITAKQYNWWAAIADIAEMAAMMLVFIKLGIAGDQVNFQFVRDIPVGHLIALVFIPPIVSGLIRWHRLRDEFYKLPVTLAFVAAVAAAFASPWGKFLVIFMLVCVYIVFLQFWNEAIFDEDSPSRRPSNVQDEYVGLSG